MASKVSLIEQFKAAGRLANEWRDTLYYGLVVTGTAANAYLGNPLPQLYVPVAETTFAVARELIRATSGGYAPSKPMPVIRPRTITSRLNNAGWLLLLFSVSRLAPSQVRIVSRSRPTLCVSFLCCRFFTRAEKPSKEQVAWGKQSKPSITFGTGPASVMAGAGKRKGLKKAFAGLLES